MQQYLFSNSSIDLACEEVGKFLASADVELREALRIKLTLEEVLLKYQSKFGEEAAFRVRCVKRFSEKSGIYHFTFFDFFGDTPNHLRDKCFVAVKPNA